MTGADRLLLNTIHDEVKIVRVILTGNGEPSKGVVVRLDRLEGKAKRATWIIATLFGCLATALFEFCFKLL